MEITVGRDRTVAWRGRHYRCALGRGGTRRDKREGDGATPLGLFPLRAVLYRPDRLQRPTTALPVRALAADDGWCDEAGDPLYNRPVRLPYGGRAERLWREDAIYDLIVTLGHNDDPVVPGAGSAVFLHIARPDYGPTEGCVAVARRHLLEILEHCDRGTCLRVRK